MQHIYYEVNHNYHKPTNFFSNAQFGDKIVLFGFKIEIFLKI